MLEQLLVVQTETRAPGAVRVQSILGVESELSSKPLHKVTFSELDLDREA